MGWTSENVSEDFNISREDMDKFAAMYAGLHTHEIHTHFTQLVSTCRKGSEIRMVRTRDCPHRRFCQRPKDGYPQPNDDRKG